MPTDLLITVKALVDEELLLFQKLGELVDREELAVESSDMESLLRILEEKQSVISGQESLLEKWSGVSSRLGLKEGREGPVLWDALALQIGNDGYSEIASQIKKIREAGLHLLEREGIVREKLEANLQEMRQLLRQLGTGRNALAGYTKNIGRF